MDTIGNSAILPSGGNQSYSSRLRSIDFLRGLALILMVLDHVRTLFCPTEFDPTDLSHASISLFLTRFITHFCAPAFIFLAGVSAYLYGLKRTRQQLSVFLFSRGVWLILIEVTVVSFAWKFNFDKFVIIQVIFILGFSMILLSAFIWLSRLFLLTCALVAFFGHNLMDTYAAPDGFFKIIFHILHVQGDIYIGSWAVRVFYPIIPWFGMIFLGYYLAPWFLLPIKLRIKRFFILGLISLVCFCVLRWFNIYGDANHFTIKGNDLAYSILSFLNVTKYPPSLLFIMLTLGVFFIVLAAVEKWQPKNNGVILCFGKVSLFFYLVHLYLIHIFASIYSRLILNSPGGWWLHFPTSNTDEKWPANYSPNLLLVYVVWLLLIIIIYPLCSAYQKYKSTHNYRWLSYI